MCDNKIVMSMKRILMLLATSFIAANVCSQSLTTMTEYYDYLRTRVKRVYTVLPNDKKHGTEKCYLQTGAHFCTNTWQNGERTAVKVFFTDGSIKVDAKIAPGSTALNGFCSEYSLYAISNKGQRILGMKSKLHKAQSFDNLTNFSYTIMRDRWDIELGDWRVESYQQNYLDGKPRIRFSTSADKKTEHFITYDENGNIKNDIIYDIVSESLMINVLSDRDYNVRNGILTFQSEDERIIDIGNCVYKIPNGAQIKVDRTIPMSRNDYYEHLTNCSKDDDTGEFVINISENAFPFLFNEDLLSETIGKEQLEFLGRRLKWVAWNDYLCNINLLLTPQEFGNTGDGVYVAGNEFWTVEATYNGGELSYLSIADEHKTIKGMIVDNLLNGEGEYMVSSNRETYKGQFKNNLKDGNGVFENSQIKYDGEFKQGEMHGKGTKVYINQETSETGEFVKGNLINGLRIIKTPQYTVEYKIVDGTARGDRTTWDNGDYYTGNDIMHFNGKGEMHYANGDYFCGNIMELLKYMEQSFKDGAIDYDEVHKCRSGEYKYHKPQIARFETGKIRITLKSGYIYEGDYNKGFNGTGKLILTNGDEVGGEFVNNQLDVYKPILVKLKLSSGEIFEGIYEMGKFNGPGKLIRNNGEIVEGTFKNGKMIENPKVKLPIKNIIIPTIDFNVNQY